MVVRSCVRIVLKLVLFTTCGLACCKLFWYRAANAVFEEYLKDRLQSHNKTSTRLSTRFRTIFYSPFAIVFMAFYRNLFHYLFNVCASFRAIWVSTLRIIWSVFEIYIVYQVLIGLVCKLLKATVYCLYRESTFIDIWPFDNCNW